MLVALQVAGVAAVPLKATVLVPCEEPKLVPETVTGVPTAPEVADSPEIAGDGTTVNDTPLLLKPLALTTTLPVVVPVGTGTMMLELLQLVGTADRPLNVTLPEVIDCVAPKLYPAIVTLEPTGPAEGRRLLVLGGKTVKLTPLLFTPLANTTTFPVVAPDGTVTPILVALQLPTVAVVPLNVTVPLPWLDPKLFPAMVTDVPHRPDAEERLVMPGAGTTVKKTTLLFTPLANTTTLPLVAPDGTVTPILVALQLPTVAVVPLNFTVLVPCVDPKFVPVIVTEAPTAPVVGDKVVMFGVPTTVKLTPLLFTPLANTTTFPVVAPDGTVTPILVALQLPTVAVVPLNVTVPLPWLDPKFVPVIVTEAPTAPVVGDKLVMWGAGTTVKLTPLLLLFETVTTTLPVVAPVGTVATMVVALQLVAVAVVPLNFTVLVPCVDPKFDPAIVIEAPTAPGLGDRIEMVGAAARASIAKEHKKTTAKIWIGLHINSSLRSFSGFQLQFLLETCSETAFLEHKH